MSEDSAAETSSICVYFTETVAIVEVSGEIDIANIPSLSKALLSAVESGRADVVLDVHGISYIDSAALQTILSASEKLSEKGCRLAVVGCHGILEKQIRMAGLQRQIPMYENILEVVRLAGDR